VVEETDVAEELLNTLGRPRMEGEPLNAHLGVIDPLHRLRMAASSPWLDEESSGANIQRASTEGGVSLLGVVEADKEAHRPHRRHGAGRRYRWCTA
jgi:hypothetical protein